MCRTVIDEFVGASLNYARGPGSPETDDMDGRLKSASRVSGLDLSLGRERQPELLILGFMRQKLQNTAAFRPSTKGCCQAVFVVNLIEHQLSQASGPYLSMFAPDKSPKALMN